MEKFNIPLNLPKRYRKGVMATFGVMVPPFYRCDEVAPEGAPVVLDTANPGFVKVAVAGEDENGVFGVLAQQVYDPATLGELANYEFHNNTKARKGDTVGVITGQGWIETINYTGSVKAGDRLYPGADGKLTATMTGNDKPVGVAENAGTNGDVYVRVRVNFDWFADVATDPETSI